jgi:hypothetical protein
MSDVIDLDILIQDWITLPELAERLGRDISHARQLVNDRHVLACRRRPGTPLLVPAAFVAGGALLKGLPGLLTVLADAGYGDEAALRWLFTEDPSLPGSPVQALTQNRGTEVKRRAQAMAF